MHSICPRFIAKAKLTSASKLALVFYNFEHFAAHPGAKWPCEHISSALREEAVYERGINRFRPHSCVSEHLDLALDGPELQRSY